MGRTADFVDGNLLALQISRGLVGRTLLHQHLDTTNVNTVNNLDIYAVFDCLEKLEIGIGKGISTFAKPELASFAIGGNQLGVNSFFGKESLFFSHVERRAA